MVATLNRVTPFLDEPRKQLPLPTAPATREAVLTDAVFAAVAALQGLLTNSDPKVVLRAAEMILSLETTRQRHGRAMIGMEAEPERDRLAPRAGRPHPLAERADHAPKAVNRANPLDLFIEKVRAELQSQEDADGTGVIVSREQAEGCARYIQANAHHTPPFDPTPAGRRLHDARPPTG